MPLWLKLALSALLVVMVFAAMWRIPRRDESFFNWAPTLALISAWLGLIASVVSLLLWILPVADPIIALLLLVLDPAAVCTGTLVLWIYRRHESTEHTIYQQKLQAMFGIALGIAAVAAGYTFIFWHKAPGTTVGI